MVVSSSCSLARCNPFPENERSPFEAKGCFLEGRLGSETNLIGGTFANSEENVSRNSWCFFKYRYALSNCS